MKKIRCRHCQTSLRLPPGFGEGTIKCPKCGGRTTVTTLEGSDDTRPDNEIRYPSEPNPVTAAPPIANADTTQAVQQEHAEPSIVDHDKRHRSGESVWSRLWRLTDVRFKHYMTPWIIRFTWVCVMVLVLFWILMLGGSTALSWIPSEPSSTGRSNMDTTNLGTPNLEMLEKIDIGSLLSKSLLGGSAEARPGFLGAVERFGWGLFKFVTVVISIILFVLWSRVMLETLIVIFDISNTLKRIESQNGSPPTTFHNHDD